VAKYVNSTGTMYTWVRDCATDNPLAPAIEAQGRRLSYEELLDLVDRLAARLVEACARPPRAVGLLAARSLATYAGYLAALRLGATVVPLNPRIPAARNQSMCRLSGVDVVVVDDDGAALAGEVVAAGGIATVPLLRGDAATWWDESLPRPYDGPLPAGPDAVAYTLFTSGSTGEPKGVPIRHRNVGPYVAHCVDRYAAGPGARLSQAFELTFDPSVFDMFVAWCSGATLVVPQPEEILTPARFVAGSGITHWFSVPSVVSIARRLRMLRPNCMPELRWSLFAGEQLSLSQAAAWAKAAPASTIENIYGPTELTVTCVGYRLPADPADWPETSNATVPIGQGYPHLEIAVLDERGAAATDGELCVRGSQRFDGYIDPADNAGRFLRYDGDRAQPLDGPPGPDSWYRTGDRVRYEGGELVHLGRFDDQIKLHGYRIELGEIESALRRHPSVAEVVVLAVTAQDGEVDLQAFYTGEPIGDGELVRLMEDLPGYMRPRGYHHREALPTNLNGKTDRRRLAAEFAAPPGAVS
jgi:amino acid adenylation domain-containing protein